MLEDVYIKLSSSREEDIAKLAGCSVETAREWLYNDWPEGAEHYAWLYAAPDTEIASWLAGCLAS